MPEIADCQHCLFFAHHSMIVCALHPGGPDNDDCVDYRFEEKQAIALDSTNSEVLADFQAIDNLLGVGSDIELWVPEGYKFVDGELVRERDDIAYYNGEAMRPPERSLTPEQQLELLDTHPLFTNRCPQCEMPYPSDYQPLVHWDCPYCGWKDDSV